MGDTVWICEKPGMGKALASVLGIKDFGDGSIQTKDGAVTWGFGHMLGEMYPDEIDEKFKKWRFEDLPLELDEIPLKTTEGRAEQLAKIGRMLRNADRVVIATDADRAGERIGREIIEHHKYRGRIERLMLRSPEPADIRDAISDMNKDRQSAERTHPWAVEERARAFEDWHIGMVGSRAGTIRLRPGAFHQFPWSVGGVQTPTLKLIVMRDLEIENFKSRDFYTIDTAVKTDRGTLTLTHQPKDKIFDRATADAIQAAARGWAGELEVETKPEKISPYKLFGQTSLQKTAGAAFGWAPAKTLEVAQGLYERGHITYPRGDCEYIGTSSLPKIRSALEKIRRFPGFEALDRHLSKAEPVIRDGSRYNDAKVKLSAHEAIVPTSNVPDMGSLSGDQRALYGLLARNLAANHMPDGIDDTKAVEFSIDVEGEKRRFALNGRRVREPGWRALLGKEAQSETEKPMPDAANGDKGRATDARVETGKTQPPKRWALWDIPSVMSNLEEYVEDAPLSDNERKALLAALKTDNPDEPRGLGTPATRASVIGTLVERAYIEVVDSKGNALSADQVRAALDDDSKKKPKPGKAASEKDGKEGKAGGKKALLVRATVNGRALIEAWSKVYPRLVDPVERARLEDELKAIGRSGSIGKAQALFVDLKKRVHANVRALVGAVAGAERVHLSDADASSMRRVSKKQLDYAAKLATWRKVKIPDEVKADAGRLSEWIDANKPKDTETFVSKKQVELAKKIVEIMKTGDDLKKLPRDHARVLELIETHPVASWPVSEGQRKAAEHIAKRQGIELPENWQSDNAFVRKILDDNPIDPKNPPTVPASPKSLDYARNIAERKGIKFDSEAMAANQALVSKFIEDNADARGGGSGRRRDAGGRDR